MNLNTAIQEKDPEFIEQEDISRRLYVYIPIGTRRIIPKILRNFLALII